MLMLNSRLCREIDQDIQNKQTFYASGLLNILKSEHFSHKETYHIDLSHGVNEDNRKYGDCKAEKK